MKACINLLPWRLQAHRRQSRMLLWKLMVVGLTVVVLTLSLNYIRRQISADLAEKRSHAVQIAGRLRHIEQQVGQLRRNYAQQERSVPVGRDEVMRVFTLLSGLPLVQGELTECILQADQLVLTGSTANQTEFERLNRFLTAEPSFRQVILAKFMPQQDGSLQFQFTLLFKEQE